ncbi:hypothetical protein ABBQ38_012900 [Trebouxia sp. C0009 RCD-2024]
MHSPQPIRKSYVLTVWTAETQIDSQAEYAIMLQHSYNLPRPATLREWYKIILVAYKDSSLSCQLSNVYSTTAACWWPAMNAMNGMNCLFTATYAAMLPAT